VFPFPAFGVLQSAVHPENGGSNPFAGGATVNGPNGGAVGALAIYRRVHAARSGGGHGLPGARSTTVPSIPPGSSRFRRG
jgi:hypothetical protein